jgi:alpha-ribazole phosphatase
MKLWLVRHPPTLAEPGLCYGASDVPVDPQALQACAQQLIAQLPQHAKIISSPLQRCEQLAQVLCRPAGRLTTFSYQTDTRLAEMYFGAWEMQPWSRIAVSELSAWTDDFAHYRCGGTGESTVQFLQRVTARLQESLSADHDEIWITHAGVIRALLWLHRQTSVMPSVHRAAAITPALLACVQSHAWPRDEVAFGQVLPLDWSM